MTGTEPRSELIELGNQLRIINGRMTRRLRLGDDVGEVTLADLSVLSRLDRHGALGASALAEQEHITPQAVSVIIAGLEDRGFVVRVADADDGRRLLVSATPAGRRLLAGRRSQKARRVAAALDQALSPDELAELVRAIPLLFRLVEAL